MITPLRAITKRCKRLTPLLAAPAALLLSQGQAKAVLTYNIFESAGNVVVQTSGSLNLPSPIGTGACNAHGMINSSIATICTGPFTANLSTYPITGPTSFNGPVTAFANSSTGIATILTGTNAIGLPAAYVSGAPIVSSSTFNGQTLASLGFTTTGLIGTWTLGGTSDTIQVFLGPPSPSGAAVPGPLPLLGAGAAFGWSRRLRKRIATPLITPPQV